MKEGATGLVNASVVNILPLNSMPKGVYGPQRSYSATDPVDALNSVIARRIKTHIKIAYHSSFPPFKQKLT